MTVTETDPKSKKMAILNIILLGKNFSYGTGWHPQQIMYGWLNSFTIIKLVVWTASHTIPNSKRKANKIFEILVKIFTPRNCIWFYYDVIVMA